MIEPRSLEQLLAQDPLASVHAAIVATIDTAMPDVKIVVHPGKVDLSELVARSIVAAPGVGIGWSKVRRAMMIDGSYGAAVDWTAYIVAEAKPVANRRVEKEAVGLAIGSQLLRILADEEACFWGLHGVLPPSSDPAPELKPFFTVKDASRGTAYYVVTWTQVIADIGESLFETGTVQLDPDQAEISYPADRLVELTVPTDDDDA